jgi:hypothetical protein
MTVIRNCIHTQCIGTLRIQIGGTVFVLGEWKPNWFDFVIWSPIVSCGQRKILGLKIANVSMQWMSKGETHPGHYRYDDRFQIRFCK